MARDSQHQELSFQSNETLHHYGEKLHLISSPLMLSLLAKLGHPQTHQPMVNDLIEMLYNHLMDQVIDKCFPRKFAQIETRMKELHPQAIYEGEVIDGEVPCVLVGLARAGTYPSHLCYQKLNFLMNPKLMRQDHFYINRACDENGVVSGVTVSGSKIGGGVADAIVILPDPMGATGNTIIEAYHHYKNKLGAKPFKIIAMHLIITPEYARKVMQECPDLEIFALRLDRGLSRPEVLLDIPGKKGNEEIGLNEHQYIVPGAGGLGEVLNNSYC